MAAGNVISAQQFANFLVTQEPVYDKEILKDIRPFDGLIGYFETGSFDAYSGVEHTYDRFNSVFPNVTQEWTTAAASDGNPVTCVDCDVPANKIGWGWTRRTYSLENQSWESQLLCFDDIMTRTKAKEHFRQIIDDVLRPATNWIMTYYLQRKAMELAGYRFVVTTGLPEFNFTWDAGGYVYLNLTNASGGGAVDATGRLTADILRSRVRRQYFLGAIMAGKQGFDKLELHTDMDTFHYMQKEDSTIQGAWRFGEFGPAAKEFYEFGLSGYIGDFMVKVLQFPLRFNRVSAGRYQLVLPYVNEAASEGIRSVFNTDYDNAQYQISYINNRRALRVLPFRPEAVNPNMPFMVRDYGGRWRFATNDLGADAAGRPIDNSRGNKGKFYSDFRVAVKPEHDEWLEAIFHKVDKACITIVDVCNDDPGYPSQSYDSEDDTCPVEIVFTAVKCTDDDVYDINADSIFCDGNLVNNLAISEATLTNLVAALNNDGPAGALGTWAVYDEDAGQISLTDTTCDSVDITFTLECTPVS